MKSLNPPFLRRDQELDELKILQTAISDGVLVVDDQLTPIFFNSKLRLLFPMSDMGPNLNETLSFIHNLEVVNGFREVMETGKAITLHAQKFHFSDGGRIYLSVSLSPLKVGSNARGVIGIFHDVTELKTAEQMRIDFVANVSHELRTPLTSIQGYVETLLEDAESGRKVETSYLKVVQRNTQRLLTLIDDLLDLSTLESNPAALHKEKLDTHAISERVMVNLSHKSQLKKQHISVNSIEGPQVFADPRRLEQVLTNLLDNAIKFTPNEGKIKIDWFENLESPGVFLKISDTGPGITAKHHARLFERFFRVDKARSRDMGGTGLGLAIVKHIMQSHQGTVEVESTPGEGTTFICAFPHPKNIKFLGDRL